VAGRALNPDPYEHQVEGYDLWFERNRAAYISELRALESLMPQPRKGLEVGVGTGRFASPLGVAVGLDPSLSMIEAAKNRGVLPVRGVAEKLPFGDEKFDLVLMVTVVFLLRDRAAAFREAHRVLLPEGSLVAGFIDRDSLLGQRYQKETEERDSSGFLDPEEMADHLEEAGFSDLAFAQTLFSEPEGLKAVETPKPGCGQGSFVVVRGKKRG
jgi:SAM-dependent methyltransferase